MKLLNPILFVFLALVPCASSASFLELDPAGYIPGTLTMPGGQIVEYKAYEGLYFVKNVEDSTFQTLNIYVPEKRLSDVTPVFIRTYIGGYMPATAKAPSATDATGRALLEGYIVCIPGSRGLSSTSVACGELIHNGVVPAALLDLKAAIRYLRYNAKTLSADPDRIIIDGTSAGGAMASLIGATGNAEVYESYLLGMGAADETDDVYAAVCYCPITDLDHADMEYEWLYGCTNGASRKITAEQKRISEDLAALCPDYINSLDLKDRNGNVINADNYENYLKSYLIASAQRALAEGCVIPDSIGIERYSEKPDFGDGRGAPSFVPGRRMPSFNRQSDFVTDIDLVKYLNYVVSETPLKTPPAFDAYGVIEYSPTNENKVFAWKDGNPVNFTDFSLSRREDIQDAVISSDMKKRIFMYNPMAFIGAGISVIAPHWFIRHGAKDRDTSFLVPINLATKLENNGYDVDFFLPWNRPHSGDYNLDDLFGWLGSLK